jgi:ribonuclease-3
LLELALTHRSFAYESGGLPTNERLEFLGDSVLGLIITEELYSKFPDLDESRLSPLRSGVVNTKALAVIARELSLGDFVRIGKGEESSGGRDKNSILADSLEAIVGAIYLEHGLAIATKKVLEWFTPLIDSAIFTLTSVGVRIAFGSTRYFTAKQNVGRVKSFVDDLIMETPKREVQRA